MEYFFKQLKKLRDKAVFDARKKDAVRGEVVSYMRATKAVREQELVRQNIGKRSATLTNTKIKMRLVRFAVPLAIVVLLGGGTSFAAASALPGDALYPVKVNVNEKFEGAFKFSAEEKAEFQAKLAEKRLAEGNTLAAQGRLNAEASARVEAAFTAFSDRVQERIEELRESGDDEAADRVSARFEAALQAHDRALAAIKARLDNASSTSEGVVRLGIPVKAAIRVMQGKMDRPVGAGTGSSTAVRGEAAAELRIAAATRAIADASDFLEDNEDEIGARVFAKAEAELKTANNLLLRAKGRFEAEEYADAIVLANQAARMAHQVKVLVHLQLRIEASAEGSTRSNLGNTRLDLFGNSSSSAGINVDL